jgi:hypothetical protein
MQGRYFAQVAALASHSWLRLSALKQKPEAYMEDSPTLALKEEDLYLVRHIDLKAHDVDRYRGKRSKR